MLQKSHEQDRQYDESYIIERTVSGTIPSGRSLPPHWWMYAPLLIAAVLLSTFADRVGSLLASHRRSLLSTCRRYFVLFTLSDSIMDVR